MLVKENIKSVTQYLTVKSLSARSNQISSAISAIDQRSTQSERVKNTYEYKVIGIHCLDLRLFKEVKARKN